jgi:hypothetical protein
MFISRPTSFLASIKVFLRKYYKLLCEMYLPMGSIGVHSSSLVELCSERDKGLQNGKKLSR